MAMKDSLSLFWSGRKVKICPREPADMVPTSETSSGTLETVVSVKY